MALFAELKSKTPLTKETEPDDRLPKRDLYGDPSYWEERYLLTKDENTLFEWLLTFEDLKKVLVPELEKCGAISGTILHPGCGNSKLGTDLRKNGCGVGGILNTDISPTVIEMMQKLYPDCKYVVDDALSMSSAFNCGFSPFNAVIDKGTLDAFACTDGITLKKKTVNEYLNEVLKLLAPNGTLIVISFGQPETRLHFFDQIKWEQCGEIRTLKSTSGQNKQEFFVYVFKARLNSIEECNNENSPDAASE